MNTLSAYLPSRSFPLDIRYFLSLLDRSSAGTLQLTTPEGDQLLIGSGDQFHADIHILDWDAIRKIFRFGDIGLGECYRDKLIDSSSMTNLIRFGIRNQQILKRAVLGHPILRLGYRLKHLLRANTRKGSRRNISAHYDLGNDFYRLWLDPSMTYSSAVFDGDNSRSLESAQQEKYHQVLTNSGAKKGDIVLEIGCGWGGFADHAASVGVNVHGITLSKAQLAFADKRMQKAGLDQSVELELRDYRDLAGEYDHIVSIEMLEAVGEEYWPVYFAKIKQLLRPKGRAVIQVITIDDDYFEEYRKRTDFIQQHIFPGGLLPSVARLQSLSADHQLKVVKIKHFGKDYAETIRRWQQKFEATTQTILVQGFDDSFLRLWRCYFNYCEAGFDEGRINVVHLVLEND